jgi:hypothetical protein
MIRRSENEHRHHLECHYSIAKNGELLESTKYSKQVIEMLQKGFFGAFSKFL